MTDYVITFSRSARKELESLDGKTVRRIFPKLETLAKQPRPAGCRKLVGEENLWRVRVGEYRIIYSVDDSIREIDIIAIRHRRSAYQ
jgi:mRNA interferase RelE/StbE